jgi:recombination protein RecA
VVFINQIRMKIGVMFGNPETTTGGNALKFYSSVRLDIRRIAALKDGENVIGNRTRVKVVKNKMAPPFKEVEFDILYGEGISREGDILDLAANFNVVEKSGTWYTYKDERIGQGRENARNYLKERPEMLKTMREETLKKAGVGLKPTAAGASVAGAPVTAEKMPEKMTDKMAEKPSMEAVAAKAKANAAAAASAKGHASSKK